MDVSIACPCPGTPHPDGDTVTLRDELDFRTAARVRNEVMLLDDDDRQDTALVLAVLQEAYLLHGIAGWTLTGADGQPVPVSPDTVRSRLLPFAVQAMLVADAGDDLYTEAVMAPLVARAQKSSQATQTVLSTLAMTGSQPAAPAQPTPLKRSSTSTTRTGGTAAASA